MEFLKRPFLWLSIILFPLLYVADKVFLIDSVRDHFIQPGGMMYYRQRKELLTLLQKHLQTKKESSSSSLPTVVVLGDSRSFGIGKQVALYAGYSKADIWNFAGPQAVPAYHDYLIEKMLSMPNPPKYFILGLSPDGLARNAGIFGSPVLTYGVDSDFILKNVTMIPKQDQEIYNKSRQFALQGLQFSFGTLFSRILGSLTQPNLEKQLKQFGLDSGNFSQQQLMALRQMATVKHEDLSYYNYQKSPHRLILNATYGAQLAWWGRMSDDELKKETDQLVSLYLKQFVVSQEQMFFLERSLKRIKQAGATIVIFWPAVNPHLRKVYEEEPAIFEIWSSTQSLAKRYDVKTFNFNNSGNLNCHDYYDASHLSVTCFPEITTTLLQLLLNKSPDQRPGQMPVLSD